MRARSTSGATTRSEEHTSELQSQSNLVCRLLLEKKKFLGSYSRAVVDSHRWDEKGNVVRALPKAAAAPATVSGELHSISHWSPLQLRACGGTAANRDP